MQRFETKERLLDKKKYSYMKEIYYNSVSVFRSAFSKLLSAGLKAVIVTMLFIFCADIQAQSVYSGYNLNFSGGYNGWKARSGIFNSSFNTTNPTYVWNNAYNDPATATADGFPLFVINSNLSETDTRTTSHPLHKIPEGYLKSSQINNHLGNATCSELKYTLDVADSNSLLTFNYAMVLEAPGHTGYQNPTFQIDVVLLNNTNENLSELVDDCAMFEQVGDNSLVDNQTWFSSTAGWSSSWVWCEWQQIAINLGQYEGERVTIRIRLGDCCYTAHGALGYVVASAKEPTITVAGCADEGNIITSAVAPDGFDNYEWFKVDANTSTQSAMATAYSNATILGNEQEFRITEDMMNGQTTQYFAVKLTSPRTQTTRPNCVAYIRTKVDDMRPNMESATYIPVPIESEEDEIGFKFSQVMPRSESFPLIWQSIEFGDDDHADFVKSDAGIWTVDPDVPLSANTRVVLDNTGSVDTVYHIYTPGTYTAKRYAQSVQGDEDNLTYCTRHKDIEVFVAERPSLRLTGTETICYGAKDTIYASSPNNTSEATANYIYKWWYSIDDTASAPVYTGTNFVMTDVTETTQVVCKVEDSQNGFSRFGYYTVNVQAFPDLTLTGDTLLCIGQNANISVEDATGNTVALQWTFIDPAGHPVITNPQTNPVLQFTPTRDTTVFLIAKTSAGCVNYDSIHIYLTIPTVSASISKVCPGDEVILTGAGQHVEDYSFTASPIDASLQENVRSTDPVTVTPMQTTTYTMDGYSIGGCSAQVSTTVTVIPYPIATISVTPPYVDTDEPVLSVSDVSPYGATSHWTFSDGGVSDARTVNYEFHDLNSDSVSIFLLTANELGCTDSTSIRVPIELFAVWMPNAFTPNGDGSNDRFFFMTNNTLEDVKFEIYNRWGTKVYSYEEKQYSFEAIGQDPVQIFGWDGMYKGKYCENGTYVWRLTYRREGNTRVYDQSGTLTLVR